MEGEARARRVGAGPALVMLPGAVIGGFLVNPALEWFFHRFNRGFSRAGRWYVRIVGSALRIPVFVLVVYGGVLVLGGIGYSYLPTGFIPQQDKGYLIASVQLPDATAAAKTCEKIDKIARIIHDYEILIDAWKGEDGAEMATERLRRDGRIAKPDEKGDIIEPGQWYRRVKPVKHVSAVAGNSFVLSAYGSNFGSMFVILDDYAVRRDGRLYADEVRTKLVSELESALPESQVALFGAPAVSGLGRAGGFRYMIEDRGDVGPEVLREQTDNFIAKSKELTQVTGLFTVYKTNSPQVFVDIDRMACMAKGVSIDSVNTALQACMGAQYVNDFNLFGRTWQVNVQADKRFRYRLDDILLLKVRNMNGGMVPLASVVKVKERSNPLVISRYNMYPAAAVNGNVAAGVSTGDARIALDALKYARASHHHGCGMDRDRLRRAARRALRTPHPRHLHLPRRHHDPRLRLVGRVRLPGAGGSLRKLGVPAGGDPGRAGLRRLLVGGGVADRSWVGGGDARQVERERGYTELVQVG